MAISLLPFVLGLFSAATGRDARPGWMVRYAPATDRDARQTGFSGILGGLAGAIYALAIAEGSLNLIGLALGPLAVSIVLDFTAMYRDRRDGRVSTLWAHFKRSWPGSGRSAQG